VYRLVLALTLVAAAGCATKQVAPPAAQPVDLKAARDALELAREAGADERAPDSFGRAQGHLNEAEALAVDVASHDSRRQSEWLGRLATVEAQCSMQIAQQQEQESDQRSLTTQEVEKRNEKIRRHEGDQRRLEEQVALLKRELDFTETEMIRTKARLKGIETKAEASSAIAEGRILLGRMIEEKGSRSQDVQRAQEALQRAETLLREENFGAAIFFAQKAQDAAMKAHELRSAQSESERPAPSASYLVKAPTANLRKGPGTTEAVVARVVKGTQLKASVMRGDWIRVEHAGATGWIHRSLVE
jgi:SH3 domain-containing protein